MATESSKAITIKDWSEEDRPREKLSAKGRTALSDAELIAILLNSGYQEKTALDVAKELLLSADNDLETLSKFNEKQLSKIKGIGPARAVTIMAALELGRRRKFTDKQDKQQVTSSRMVRDYFIPYMTDLQHEEFYILLINRASKIIKHSQISKGGVSMAAIDPKLIFKMALEELAPSIILCHNHPSGNTQPSPADKELTRRIVEGGKHLDIQVLDHIIFTNDSYYSFADNGLI